MMRLAEEAERTEAGKPLLVLLDLDGTVIDIAARPDHAFADPRLKETLARMHERDPLSLVLVTGRALADADRLLDPLRLNAVASHGAELRVAGTEARHIPPRIDSIRPLVEALVRPFAGAVIEWKPYSVAIHIRNVPALARPLEAVLSEMERSNRTYRIQKGRMVYEIVPREVSKERAVRRLLGHLPYAGRSPVYIGDDPADEDAMHTVAGRGGRVLRVAGEHFAAASADFASPAEVRDWLCRLAY